MTCILYSVMKNTPRYDCFVSNFQRKVKLIIAALVLGAIVYVVPMAFDHSIRFVHAASSSSRNVTNIVLADDTLFRLLYGKALALIVVVVPLVWLIGVTISLPTTWRALKRSTVDSGSAGNTRVRDLVQQLQRAGRSGSLCQMNDIINVVATLAAVLLLVYVPQVSCLSSLVFVTVINKAICT